ncbi:MAG: xanthine dehydrogenase family protein molybdopterin-binding subunit [Nitrososphaerales archaeon]
MKKKGVGISCVLHPSGNKGAGDPSAAAIQLRHDGTLALYIGTVDLGQGSTTILRQVAAETMQVPIENVRVSVYSEDFSPQSHGSFASRVTLIDSHAVENACEDLKQKIRVWASDIFEASPDDIEVADNKVFVRGAEAQHSMPMKQVGDAVNWGGNFLVGTGSWQPDTFHPHDPETGAMPAVGAISFGAYYVEIEIDTDTGLIDLQKVAHTWEVGKAVNPLLVKAQISGGLSIGFGMAVSEDYFPYYPSVENAPVTLGDYYIPTFADYPEVNKVGIAEVPHPNGVKGMKGFSEGSANGLGSAINSAVHDALGIWIDAWPITPERVLRALEAQKA